MSELNFAKWVIEVAKRMGILQAKQASSQSNMVDDDSDAPGDLAEEKWRESWYKAIPLSGKALPWVLHCHWRGLSEEEAKAIKEGKLGMDGLLQTDHSLHFDLRLGTDRFRGAWGWTVFAGTAAENRDELRVIELDKEPEKYLRVQPKLFMPPQWLDVARSKPYISEPGGAGSTSKKYAAYFLIDSGTYRVGFSRMHAVELHLDGKYLHGRYLVQYASTAGGRVWMLNKPGGQTPYAQANDLDKVLEELREKGQKYLIWPKDPSDIKRGLKLIEVSEKGERLTMPIVKMEEERRYTLGIVYPANKVDAHGDFTTPEELEEAAWKFMRRALDGKAYIGVGHLPDSPKVAEIVESYIHRGPEWETEHGTVHPGDWVIGVIWEERAWKWVKKGKIKGFSLQGWAKRSKVN